MHISTNFFLLISLLILCMACDIYNQVSTETYCNKAVECVELGKRNNVMPVKAVETNSYPPGIYAVTPLSRLCADQGIKEKEFWQVNLPISFIGEVQEVKQRRSEEYFNGCWARFDVYEYIKGSGKSVVWVKSIYDDRPVRDYSSDRFCFFKEGAEYLVIGKEVIRSSDGEKYIYTATSHLSEPGKYSCPPNKFLGYNEISGVERNGK